MRSSELTIDKASWSSLKISFRLFSVFQGHLGYSRSRLIAATGYSRLFAVNHKKGLPLLAAMRETFHIKSRVCGILSCSVFRFITYHSEEQTIKFTDTMTPVTHDLVHTAQHLYGANNLAAQIPFGLYVFKRLLSVGVKSIFGVPGDYNMRLLEHMYDESLVDTAGDKLEWVGCCNELNAAYAADGYSRYSNEIGCVITTYGVGELGAISGLAGAFAESVKVLHIVGIVDYEVNDLGPEMRSHNLHHLLPRLNDSNFVGPDYRVYAEMVKDKVACSVEYLDDLETACDKVDKVIEDIYKYSKPGYLFVPRSFVDELVSTKNLIEKPTITLRDCIEKSPVDEAKIVTERILRLLNQSASPAVIGDMFTDRYGLRVELNDFINKTNIVGFSTVQGKSIIDESSPLYMGAYNGMTSAPTVSEKLLACDLVLHFGIEKNEVNYGNYNFPHKSDAKIVELHPQYIRFYDNTTKKEEIYKGVSFVDILDLLNQSPELSELSFQYNSKFKAYTIEELNLDERDFGNDETSDITQGTLQKSMPNYLNPGDVLISDTGTFQFAIRDFSLPSQVKYITQGFYLSIGMALPAALGVGIAMRDYPMHHVWDVERIPFGYEPKVILFEGDGAAQMTVQELSTMIRHQVPIEIFLWNNNGYTIERVIEGPTRPYNDIQPWKWTKLLEAFGDFDGKHSRATVLETRSQLENKLSELKYKVHRRGIDFMEVKLATMDVPSQLQKMIDAIVKN